MVFPLWIKTAWGWEISVWYCRFKVKAPNENLLKWKLDQRSAEEWGKFQYPLWLGKSVHYLKCYDALCRRSPFLSAQKYALFFEMLQAMLLKTEPNLSALPFFCANRNDIYIYRKMYSCWKPLDGSDPYTSFSLFSKPLRVQLRLAFSFFLCRHPTNVSIG